MEPRARFLLQSIVLILYAIYLCWRIYEQERKLDASKSWPFAKVMILSKTVVEEYGKSSRWFTPYIFYSFTVDGESITGKVTLKSSLVRNAVWKSPDPVVFLKARQSAEHRLEKMAEKIEIRYNPEKPKERVCSLDPIKNYVPRLILCIMIALSLIGLSYLVPSS